MITDQIKHSLPKCPVVEEGNNAPASEKKWGLFTQNATANQSIKWYSAYPHSCWLPFGNYSLLRSVSNISFISVISFRKVSSEKGMRTRPAT